MFQLWICKQKDKTVASCVHKRIYTHKHVYTSIFTMYMFYMCKELYMTIYIYIHIWRINKHDGLLTYFWYTCTLFNLLAPVMPKLRTTHDDNHKCVTNVLVQKIGLVFPWCLLYFNKKTQHSEVIIVHPDYLVGGFNPSEKYESQLGLLFPTYGKMFQSTNQS